MKKRYIRYYLLTVIFIYSTVLFNINFISGYSSIGETSSVNVYSEKSSYELVSEGGYFTPCMNSEGNKILYSSGDDLYELDLAKNDIRQLTVTGNCYNPVYYMNDNNIAVYARTDGIYKIELDTKKITKLAGTDDPQVSYAKPNFTPEGDIIYFKVTVLPNSDGHGFIEKDPFIYKLSMNNNSEEKLISGYNPVISKDGKKLLYEMKDNIYLYDFETKDSKLIDKGKYAAWSNSGDYISYAKFDRSAEPYTKLKGKRKLFIDKEFSNIYIADLNNLKKKYKLTKEEYENRDLEIESWVNDAKDSPGEQHFLLVSRVAYFDSEWAKDDNALYVSVYNSDKGAFELIKFRLSLE